MTDQDLIKMYCDLIKEYYRTPNGNNSRIIIEKQMKTIENWFGVEERLSSDHIAECRAFDEKEDKNN